LGLIVDTGVFIAFERTSRPIDLSKWEQPGDVYISVITVSELFMGVYRADTEARRANRLAFVASIIEIISSLDFTSEIARLHAELHAYLAKRGQLIGAHDLIIAATARQHGLPVLTNNFDEFSRIPGLHVIPYSD
jgi:predicted nucleic acid-binding protein